jgi:hypothetical protein
MPNKHNALGRHHIPKMKFRVKNWAEYDAGLRRRGSLTLWVTAEVLDGWNGRCCTDRVEDRVLWDRFLKGCLINAEQAQRRAPAPHPQDEV